MLRPRVVHAALAAVAALLVVQAAISGCDHDEIEHLHAAWLVSQGQRPFVDFLEQHHPPVWYVLAPLAKVFDGRPHAFVFAARCLDLCLIGLTIAAFTGMARRLLRNREAAWPPLLLAGCFLFLRESLEVRPDPWMLALAAIALWQWTGFLRGGALASAAWTGLALGGAIAFLQKAITFAALLAIGTVFVLGTDRRRWMRALSGGAILVACAAIPVGFLVWFEQRGGTWGDFWFWNYTFNAHYYLQTSFPRPSTWTTLALAFVEDPLLWGFGLAGLFAAPRRPLRGEPEVVLSAAIVCGTVAVLFRSRWPYSHNLIVVEPCLALLAVRPIERALTSPRLRRAVTGFFALLLVKVAVLAFVYDENPDAAGVQRTILAATAVTDAVAVPPPYHPIFRRDSFFFWYVPAYNVIAYRDLCQKRACREGKAARDEHAWSADPPVVVFAPPGQPGWAAQGFAGHASDYVATAPGLFERTGRSIHAGTR